MNAEQYRALVAKLEAITEAPVAAFNQNAGTPPDAAAPVGSVAADPAVAPTETPAPTPTPATDPNQIPTIEAATFSQAYAQAKKQGLKKFKWCGVYAVKDKPQPVRPQPAKAPAGKVDYLGQQDPLGGDAQNPMSFASNSNFGA